MIPTNCFLYNDRYKPSDPTDGSFINLFGSENTDPLDVLFVEVSYEECIDRLTEKQRDIYLKKMEERDKITNKPLTTRELSNLLGIPIGTLLTLIARAKASLATCLASKGISGSN